MLALKGLSECHEARSATENEVRTLTSKVNELQDRVDASREEQLEETINELREKEDRQKEVICELQIQLQQCKTNAQTEEDQIREEMALRDTQIAALELQVSSRNTKVQILCMGHSQYVSFMFPLNVMMQGKHTILGQDE